MRAWQRWNQADGRRPKAEGITCFSLLSSVFSLQSAKVGRSQTSCKEKPSPVSQRGFWYTSLAVTRLAGVGTRKSDSVALRLILFASESGNCQAK